MWQQSEIKAQDAPCTQSIPSRKQASELIWDTDEEQAQSRPDFFREEAVQYYKSQKNDPVSLSNMTARLSLLLWLALAVLLLSLVVLGILLAVAGVPVLGLGKETIAI